MRIFLLILVLLLYGCGEYYDEPVYDVAQQEKYIPWSLLGGTIVYSVYLSWEGGTTNNVYCIDVPNRRLRQIFSSSFSSQSLAISPESDSVAISSFRSIFVFKMDSGGLVYPRSREYSSPFSIDHLSWRGSQSISSTGYDYDTKKSVLCLNGKYFSALSREVTSRAAWTSDGSIAVVCVNDSLSDGSLYRFTMKDSSLVPLLQPQLTDSIFYWDPAISPDGTSIVFVKGYRQTTAYGTYQRDGASLCLMNFDGTGVKTVLHSPTVNFHMPCWSPDGKKILYGAGGNIRLINIDGTNDIHVCDGGYPSWGK